MDLKTLFLIQKWANENKKSASLQRQPTEPVISLTMATETKSMLPSWIHKEHSGRAQCFAYTCFLP